MQIEALADRYPAIEDLRARARGRIPHFAWEYLDSGTGLETSLALNRSALDAVQLTPRFLRDPVAPDLSTTVFGLTYSAPFGIAPIGLSGLMWPGSEFMLARAARAANIPFSLSTVAAENPEPVAAEADGNGWFQLYSLSDTKSEADILRRAAQAGFRVLLVTVDVPGPSARERQRKAGFHPRQKMNAGRIAQILARPAWAIATARKGAPGFPLLASYVENPTLPRIATYIAEHTSRTSVEHLKRVRDLWKGPMVVKGVLSEDDAEASIALGADGIVVSNHGARQIDAAPASIDALAVIAPKVKGRTAILFDSGVRTGLDIARALALGADFVLAGRAFMYGVCALGEPGAALVHEILRADLVSNMVQLGCARPGDIAARLAGRPPAPAGL